MQRKGDAPSVFAYLPLYLLKASKAFLHLYGVCNKRAKVVAKWL
jgi:hypothetical protein